MTDLSLTPSVTEHIAQRTLRLLERHGLADPSRARGPLFYAWARPDRLIMAFDPLAFRNIDALLSRRFLHHLSTSLGGRRVVATNSRGVFLQVAWTPTPAAPLPALPLDLAQQPSVLHVPIGMTRRGPLWLSLLDMDAVLIGGARRMGKTRLLHGWVQALIRGGEARLVLWDGKGGLEFGRYAAHPHVTVAGELAEALTRLNGEMVRRRELLREAGVSATAAYNTRQAGREHLPPLVLLIDEAAFIPDAARPVVAELVALGGAFGVHPVLATQRPDADAVQALVKGNLGTRIALPVPGVQDSMVVLSRPGAEKLPKVKGRLLLVWEGKLVEAQSFVVDLPGEGSGTPSAPPVLLTPAEQRLVALTVQNLDGWFKIRELTALAGESRDWINALAKQWELKGYLTPVQRERGRNLGRQVTEGLIRAAGLASVARPGTGSDGSADGTDRADQGRAVQVRHA